MIPSRIATCRDVPCSCSFVLLALTLTCCGEQKVVFQDSPVSPTQTQTAAPFRLFFTPAAGLGGASRVGTVELTLAAPSGGLVVQLSSSASSVIVPASVLAPVGARSVDFPVTTDSVPVDTEVSVRASVSGRSVDGSVSIWAVAPTFFSFASEPGEPLGLGQIRRLVPADTARFWAYCRNSAVTVRIEGPQPWTAIFGAPAGAPLRVGTYENATRASIAGSSSPGLDVYGDGRACGSSLSGRFVVHEADLTPQGDVVRFWASFEQRCGGTSSSATLRGDVRATGLSSADFGSVLTCVR